jgi:sulfotransferase|tara:strand:+ start:518 stop:1261 length:744 start_codon:yes stop_codon:yes gene_type:complete
MPRSGNTLFASIMNQNSEIVCTANSITLEIMKELFFLKKTDVFKNYPDHKSLDNVLDSVFDIYYKHWPQRIIIDRGPVMTTGNLELMQKHFKRPFKCIVILRNLIDVLASYMKWYTENPDAFPNKYNCKNDDEKLSMIMNKNGAIAKDLEAIKNSYNYPEMCLYIKYDDLVTQPEQEIKRIYNFIGEPYFNHTFKDLKQININGIGYDDTVVGKNMHTIRTEIKKENNIYLNKIPERIRQKYEHIKF